MQQVSMREGRPGQWMGVFGDSLTLLVPGAERDRALSWWALVDDGAGIETLLDALLSEGLSSLADFVLVHVGSEGEEGRVRVVVRGSATLTAWTAEGQVRVQATGRLWAEDDFVGIVALRVELPGHDWLTPVPAFAVQPGLCRVGEVVWGSVPALPLPTPPPALELAPELVPELTPEVSPPPPMDEAVRVNVVSSQTPEPEPEAAPEPDPEPALEAEPEPESALEPETVPLSAMPRVAPIPQLPPTPQTPASTPTPPWQEEVTTHLPPVELSGLTLLGLGGEPETATQSRSEPAVEPPTYGGPVRLRFSHGPDALVDRPLVIGRAPAPRSGSAGASLIAVPSPQQEISSNHVEIRPGQGVDSGTAVVTDLGSTNGTVVTQPGLGPEELRPGAPMVLLPGAVLDLGDGLRIHVDQD